MLNPTKDQLQKSSLELVVAGTSNAVLMVESEASGLSETQMLEAVKFGHENFKPVIEMISEIKKQVKKEEIEIEKKDYKNLKKDVSQEVEKSLKKHFQKKIKKQDQI